MITDTPKLILIPIDGSPDALKVLDYMKCLFKDDPRPSIEVFYVQPALPALLTDEGRHNQKIAAMLETVKQRNEQTAAKYLDEAKAGLIRAGYPQALISVHTAAQQFSTARDISDHAQNRKAAAIAMSSRGRSILEAFFMGSVAERVLELSTGTPVWINRGDVKNHPVMIVLDRSDEALKAVKHAAAMLAETDVPLTLFYTIRHIHKFIPDEVAEAVPELDTAWRQAVGEAAEKKLHTARNILNQAGVDKSRINVKMHKGGPSASADILTFARQTDCGTIVMGRRGSSDDKDCHLGAVARKVLHGVKDMAVWIV